MTDRAMTDDVLIFEMGPRDGLQNIKAHIPTAEKIRFVDALSSVGFRKIETASFVSPKAVPQMADGAAVMAGRGAAGRGALHGSDPEYARLSSGCGGARGRDRNLRLGVGRVFPGEHQRVGR